MSRTLRRFLHLTDPEEAERIERTEKLRMFQQAAPVLQILKDRLRRKVADLRWEPGMSPEQSASNHIAQSLYQTELDEIDKMIQKASEIGEEMVDG